MATPLFTDDEATDPGYCAIRDGSNVRLKLTKWHCEYLWLFFERHADREFRTELRRTFHARYWEMYLTTSLILAGYEVTCPKPGPDVGIIYRGQRIWFEAVGPDCGQAGKPDSVPTEVDGQVPEEKIILRYLNSISTKFKDQYSKWLANGTVSNKDTMVYAINPWAIPWDHTDSDPPRILQAAYNVGPPNVEVDPNSMKVVGTGYEFRGFIRKAPKDQRQEGEKIPTGVFQQKEYAWLSGLLCSRAEAVNRAAEMGADFQLAPSLHANVRLPETFRLQGTYYATKQVENGYRITPTAVRSATLF
jgi:hypothetical protein